MQHIVHLWAAAHLARGLDLPDGLGHRRALRRHLPPTHEARQTDIPGMNFSLGLIHLI